MAAKSINEKQTASKKHIMARRINVS